MKQELIGRMLREMIQRLVVLFANASRNFDQEPVHELKAEFKGFRLFLQLLKIHTGDEDLQFPRAVKQLYQIVTDLDIALTELHEGISIGIDEKEKQKIEGEIRKNILEWNKVFNTKLLLKFEARIVNVKFDHVPSVALSNFFNSAPYNGDTQGWADAETSEYYNRLKACVHEIVTASETGKRNRAKFIDPESKKTFSDQLTGTHQGSVEPNTMTSVSKGSAAANEFIDDHTGKELSESGKNGILGVLNNLFKH